MPNDLQHIFFLWAKVLLLKSNVWTGKVGQGLGKVYEGSGMICFLQFKDKTPHWVTPMDARN